MNFLNKAKEQANNIINKKEGSPMTNPFLNKNTLNNQTAPKAPAATPTAPTGIPSAPSVQGAIPKPGIPKAPGKPGIPPIPGKPGVPPVPKAPSVPGVNPFAKPEVKPAEETKTANDIANEIVKEVEAKEVPVTEEAPVVPVEEKVETPVEAPKTEEVKEGIKEEPKVEEKKTTAKKKGSSRKKTTKSEEVNDAPTTSDEVVNVIINTTELSYAEACQAVRTHFTDPEWEAAKAKFDEIAKNIHITNDMNKAQLHDLLAQVANLRDEIYSAYTETKTLYEHLTDKENGMIERTKRTGSKGSNSEERKLTATLAVMNYVDVNGNKINLYEVLDETRIRYNYLKGIIDTIEFKKAVLLTMLSSLKSN